MSNIVHLSEMEKRKRWLRQRRSRDCPNCNKNSIANSLVKTTAWCSKCEKFWRLHRNERNWKYRWWYLDELNRG